MRQSAYRDLLQYARLAGRYAEEALNLPPMKVSRSPIPSRDRNSPGDLNGQCVFLGKVIDQTDRRVFKGEKVPASEKVVSFLRIIPTSSSKEEGIRIRA